MIRQHKNRYGGPLLYFSDQLGIIFDIFEMHQDYSFMLFPIKMKYLFVYVHDRDIEDVGVLSLDVILGEEEFY